MSDPWTVAVVAHEGRGGPIRRLVDSTSGFRVVAVAQRPADGWAAIAAVRPALVVLDLELGGADAGLELLRRLRRDDAPLEVIALTASGCPARFRAALHLGVVDILVAPFEHDRLRLGLQQFERRMAVLAGGTRGQGAADALRSAAAPPLRAVPKNLSEDRLDRIRHLLRSTGEPLTSEQAASAVGVARVTARRYLEHLVSVGAAHCQPLWNGPGRPRKAYRATGRALTTSTPSPLAATA